MSLEMGFRTLDNKMMVACDKMEGVESVAISVLIKTGSRFESKEQSGISHFLEHMAFKGTKSRTARQIAESFDMIGGHFNAYTSREKTVYHAKVLKGDVHTATDILADILQNSTFLEKELEKERNVILQEMAQTNDTPDDIIFDHFQEAAFPNQPIGRSILGDEEVIKRINRGDIQKYVESHYGFNNIIISAAGSIDIEQFNELVVEKFNALPKSSSNPMIQGMYKGGESRVEKDLEQVHFVLGFEGASYHDPDYYTQKVAILVAGGGMSSRLFQEVREKRGLAYSISAFGGSYHDTGIFGVYSSSGEASINELVDVVATEMQKMTRGITEEEVARAKAQVLASLLMSRESSISRAEKYAANLAVYGRYIGITEIMEKVNAITPRDVEGYITKILTSQKQPTISSIGKIAKLYQYDTIKQKLKI